MKRMIAFGIVVLLLLSTACQQTPESPIVIGKDIDRLIEHITDNEEKKTLADMLQAPDILECFLSDSKGNVRLEANAQVVVPNAEGISSVRVQQRNFTQQEADRLLAYFIGDMEFNERYPDGFDEMVEQLMRFYADLEQETDPERRVYLERSIEKFTKAGVQMPENPEEIKHASKTFAVDEPGIEQITGFSSDDRHKHYLRIENNSAENLHRVLYTKQSNGYATHRGNYWYAWQKDNLDKVGLDPAAAEGIALTLTQNDAMQMARDALQAMDIEDMVFSSLDEVWGGSPLKGGIRAKQECHAYQLRFVRAVGDIPITQPDNGIEENHLIGDADIGETVMALWPDEMVVFIIDDSGIVEFLWQSPYEIVETVTEHSSILSFAEVQGIFEKMMLVINARSDENSITYHINRAQLGLMRIAEQNNAQKALLIPVWDFFGSYELVYTDESGQVQSVVMPDIYTSHLTVNAVDGTIIDRGLGY